MDCLRSFNFSAQGQANFVAPDVKTWLSGTETFWALERNGVSTISPRGFKNINVHGISLIGNVGTQITPALGGVIPADWNVSLKINGNFPLLGVEIAALNNFNIDPSTSANASFFNLNRYNPKVKFASPVESVSSIQLLCIRANGGGGQTAANLNIQYLFNFVVYYTFEGE